MKKRNCDVASSQLFFGIHSGQYLNISFVIFRYDFVKRNYKI